MSGPIAELAARPPSPAAVTRAPIALTRAKSGMLQRCGSLSGPDCPCHGDERRGSHGAVQRSALTGETSSATAHPAGGPPPIVASVLASPGRPLDGATRARMESRLGADFGHVRVHTDPRASESARSVGAQAYTVGSHVVFGHARYAPATRPGERLLAHELAHTIQQGGLQRSAAPDLSLDATPIYAGLEAEADRAADAALDGHAPPSLSRVPEGRSHVSRTPDDTATPRDIPGSERRPIPDAVRTRLEALGVTSVLVPPGGGATPGSASFAIRSFPLPATKGPRAQAIYERFATGNQLRATVRFGAGGRRSSGLWQSRAGTAELRDNWLQKVGWEPGAAAANWANLGGVAADPGAAFSPRIATCTCQMDHIVELQLIGTNVPENVQVLDPGPNRESGSAIQRHLNELAQNIRDTFPDDALPDEITLHFEGVRLEGAPPACPGAASGGGTAGTCIQIECAAHAGGAGAAATAAAAVPANAVRHRVYAGAQGTNVYVLAGPAATPLAESAIPDNRTAAELIAGFRLREYRRAARADQPDRIRGGADLERLTGRARETRVPSQLRVRHDPNLQFDAETGPDEDGAPRRQIRLRPGDRDLRFTYPFLSDVNLRLDYSPETGLTGSGTMRSDLPLLNRAQFDVVLGGGQLRAELRGDPRAPLPGVRVTEAVVAAQLLPELGLTGRLGFAFGPAGRPVADALLALSVDAGGPIARGDVNLRVPWVDEARGTIEYRNREWTGEIVVRTEQIRNRIPAVRESSVVIRFTRAGMTATGAIQLEIRPGQNVTLEAEYGNGRWIFTGTGRFTFPMLDPVTLRLRYDGEHLTGRGETGFTVRGLNGRINVEYRDERVSGEGSLNMTRGRMNGTVRARLLPSGVITADGQVSYAIRPDLIATVGVSVDERQVVRLSGDLVFARPIVLFRRFGSSRELFRSRTDIPIFGISVGPVSVGLVGRIEGWLTVDYGIGPGEIRNLRLHGALNPLEDDPQIELDGGAQLYIPADAGFAANVRGAIALSAGIASVSGGITATGRIGVQARAQSDLTISYRQNRFVVENVAALIGRPVLAFSLEANVEAEAGVGPLTYRYHRGYELARFELGSDLEFGIRAPIRYASDEPFEPPSLDTLEFIRPDIDIDRVMRGMFDRVAA